MSVDLQAGVTKGLNNNSQSAHARLKPPVAILHDIRRHLRICVPALITMPIQTAVFVMPRLATIVNLDPGVSS